MSDAISDYLGAPQDPSNANSTPSYDHWGPDFLGYWSLSDWITWHHALIATWGASLANQKFSTAWNAQSFGAAPINELETNEGARQYFVSSGLSNLIDPSLFGMGTDFLHTGTNISAGVEKASETFSWLIPVAGIALLYFAVQAIGKDPGGQSKKFLGGVRELY